MNQQMRQQQPFFKPLTNNGDSSSNCMYEQSSQNVSVRSKSNLNISTFQVNKHKDNESVLPSLHQQDTMIGGERLSSLHSKLQQEADKIRKWRVQTEIELKQKEHNVLELTGTVESLRKSILELQLQNESLSLKLQEEICNREEVYQRVCATRDICNLLKDHSAKTEDRLQKCETERTELKYLEKEHLKQFEELSLTFRNLEISATEKHNDLTNQLFIVKQEKEILHEEWTQKVSEANAEMKMLMDQSDEKDIEVRDIRSQLQKNDEQIHTLKLTHDDLNKQVVSCEGELKQKKESLEIALKELESANNEYRTLAERCCSLSEEIEVRKSAEEQIKNDLLCRSDESTTEINKLKLEIENIHIERDETLSRIKSLESQLEKSQIFVEELKSSKDLLLLEKAEIDNKLYESEKKEAALLLSHETYESKAQDLLAETRRLEEELKMCENECMNHKKDAEKIKTELSSVTEAKNEFQMNSMKQTEELKLQTQELDKALNELQESKENRSKLDGEILFLKEKLEQDCGKYNDILNDLQKVQKDKTILEKNLTTKGKDLEKLQKENEKRRKIEEKLTSDLEEKIHEQQRLNEKLDNIRQELNEKCRVNTTLEEEREASKKTLQGELDNLSKGTNDLENKTKSLKSDLTAKNKHIKEIEKEVKTLKSKLTNQTKSTESKEKEIEQLMEDLENTKSTIDDLKNQISIQEKSVTHEKKRADQEKKRADELKKLADTAVTEKEQSMQENNMQMTEMMSTLEKYKKENQKIVLQKEKELEQLKHGLEEANRQTKTENIVVVTDLQKQIKKLEDTIHETEMNEVIWEKKVEEKTKQLLELESSVQSKEQEIVELLNAVKTPQSNHMQSISVQTSPVKQVPSTPSVSQTPVFVTPKLQQTPRNISFQRDQTPNQCLTPVAQSDMKTPQRSILKALNIGSATKKRRVVFASEKEETQADSDSSSSELMEIEIDEIGSGYKKEKNALLLLRPSPKLPNTSPKHIKEKNLYLNDKENKETLAMTRVPRGLPVSSKRKEVCPQTADTLKDVDKNNVATKNKNDTPLCSDKKKKKHEECRTPTEKNCKHNEVKTPNVRKTPSKTQGKFFKNSPKERMKKSKLDEHETSWFDLDSVFGFGPED